MLDTKLAKQIKPHVVHQLSLYNRLLATVQGVDPIVAHLVLGNGWIAAIDLTRYAALHRRVIDNLEQVVAGPGRETYPEPVAHCAICSLADEVIKTVADNHTYS